MKRNWPEGGVYVLRMRVRRRVVVRIGKSGVIRLAPGRYLYVGRAARGILARVGRHLRRRKRLHWHIDYLLTARGVRVEAVRLLSRDAGAECRHVQRLCRDGGLPVAAGFGASDCRSGCGSHLIRCACKRPRRINSPAVRRARRQPPC